MREHNFLLSILIPTRNNPELLRMCLTAIAESTPKHEIANIQVIVSDSSEAKKILIHEAQGILGEISLTLIEQSKSFPSAESHIAEILHLADGKYLWIIGDDDFLSIEGFRELLSELHDGLHSIYALSYETVEHDFLPSPHKSLSFHRSQTVPIDVFVQDTGICTYLGRTAAIVILNSERLYEAVQKTTTLGNPVYSHVYWFLHAGYNDARLIRCLDSKPVTVRLNESSQGKKSAWRSMERDRGLPIRTIWTVDLSHIIQLLVEHNLVKNNFLRTAIEGDGYPTHRQLLNKFIVDHFYKLLEENKLIIWEDDDFRHVLIQASRRMQILDDTKAHKFWTISTELLEAKDIRSYENLKNIYLEVMSKTLREELIVESMPNTSEIQHLGISHFIDNSQVDLFLWGRIQSRFIELAPNHQVSPISKSTRFTSLCDCDFCKLTFFLRGYRVESRFKFGLMSNRILRIIWCKIPFPIKSVLKTMLVN